MSDRRARAHRLRDFFELQLRFADAVTERSGRPLRDVVLKLTSFHRRFGLGDADQGVAPQWDGFIQKLERLPTRDARVAWTQQFFETAPDETLRPGRRFFGCFGFDKPDAEGVVQIHFLNHDGDGVSPLHRDKIARRQREIADVIACVDETCPTAQSIRGMSWLYHLEAYRRLFPPQYGTSRAPARYMRLSGNSSWGQFTRHDETIKPELRDAFVANFDKIDLAAPWRCFPLPALTVSAPLAVFREFYER